MSPKWLFFPSPAPDQYIQTTDTSRTISRAGPSATSRQSDTGTAVESGSLADQFAPFIFSFTRSSVNKITFTLSNSDTSSAEYGTTTLLGNSITAATLTVGGNVFTPESITVGGTNVKPNFQLDTTDGSAGTFWSDNNLDDTDNIEITVTLTF